jgi:hypothetical protein
MCNLHQFQIKRQLACAHELEAQKAVGLNEQVILLAANVPEAWNVFHSL